jgi:hypothetical protein
LHLHLLLGVAGVEEGIDVRQHVKGDLVRVHFFLHGLTVDHRVHLVAQARPLPNELGAASKWRLSSIAAVAPTGAEDEKP